MFGLGLDDDRARSAPLTIVPPTEIPLPAGGRGIVLVTGPSGSGKSSLLRLIATAMRERGLRVIDDDAPLDDKNAPRRYDDAPDRCVIDLIAPDRPLRDAMHVCSRAGLSDAFALLRRPGELSDGQRFRFRLARAMAQAQATDGNDPGATAILIDEFAATLDRGTAAALAANLRRWIDKAPCRVTLVLATSHDDILEPLAPDVLVHKGFGSAIDVVCRGRDLAADSACEPQAALKVVIEPGTLADFRALAGFHYRSHRVGAATSVLRMVHRAPSVVGRYLARRDETQVVGVLVRAMPALACALRDVATAGRYSRHLSPHEQATLLNREVRCIARVVIDPRFRGLGLAVRLVRQALAQPERARQRFTEALAAMGRVSPFFEHAGMKRFDRPPLDRPTNARMLDALDRVGVQATDLASAQGVLDVMSSRSEADRAWLRSEFERFLRASQRIDASACRSLSECELIAAVRERLLLQPAYYIFAHPSGSIE